VLIDWFTVGAQAVNFLILVWLLQRYLYRPVLAAIDAREQKVATRIADAAAQESKAQVATEELRKRNEVFDHQREDLLRTATAEGAAERQRLIESARQDSQLLRSNLTRALAAERAEMGRQLSMRTQTEVFAVARKALSELAGASLEYRIVAVFLTRLAGAGLDSRPAGAAPAVTPVRLALVRCAFEPAPARRAEIESAIRERFGAIVTVRFETSPETVCGVELTVDGVKLAWSVADYLASLASEVAVLTATEPLHAH
jgi:F-type H+-transporting ATPase subunit b